VSQVEATVEVEAAALKEAKADEAYTSTVSESALNVRERNPRAAATLQAEVQHQVKMSPRAGRDQAAASLQEAKFALAAAKHGIGRN
jgi:hypothetical protein